MCVLLANDRPSLIFGGARSLQTRKVNAGHVSSLIVFIHEFMNAHGRAVLRLVASYLEALTPHSISLLSFSSSSSPLFSSLFFSPSLSLPFPPFLLLPHKHQKIASKNTICATCTNLQFWYLKS